MPPPCLPRCDHARTSRGSEYSIRARSTCSLASRVWARLAKMSKITSCRSITSMPVSFSQFLCCDGVSSLSKMITSACESLAKAATSSAFPEPIK